jgi:hypothetical protein
MNDTQRLDWLDNYQNQTMPISRNSNPRESWTVCYGAKLRKFRTIRQAIDYAAKLATKEKR